MNDVTRQFIRDNLNANVPALALKKAPAGTDLSLALRQIEARQLLQRKVPEWSAHDGLLFPPRLALEQCSSEATARYKASLLEGRTIADLTGGLGIDCYYLSQRFAATDYVEPQADLCAIARHNFEALGAGIAVCNESAEAYLQRCDSKDALFIDPSRRDARGRKTVGIADCTPDVAALQKQLLQKAPTVMVKLSPMLDISQALAVLHPVKEIHVVAADGECKELVVLLERGHSGEATLCCAHLGTRQATQRFTLGEERDCQPPMADQPRRYLYEPNAALMKAGCFKLPCQWFGLAKLHPNSHLYTSDRLVPDFAGRVFEVEGWSAYHKKEWQALLAGHTKANIATRNFPLSVAELRKALRMAEGGDLYLFGTTLRDGTKALVKTKKADF